MRKFPTADLVLAFVIICIAMTLTIVVAFAAPGAIHKVHHIQSFTATKELTQ
ncbi:MAG: hypothetical protein FD144_682 [Rhodospirillaceae bacterium]|nr:MAG: hypothetical protein FD144_682 [Rhodospirillaceae bacterium]